MARYDVQLTTAAAKQLVALPTDVRARVSSAIAALADDPRPPGCKKLKGVKDAYRVRVGSYRVLYNVFDDQLVVLVFRIADRKDAY